MQLRRSHQIAFAGAVAALLALLLVVAGAGCHRSGYYRASSLPPQFMAPRMGSLQNIDLSQIARASGDSERLYAGDVVEVSIATGLEGELAPGWRLRIAEDGRVKVPLVGDVRLAGHELTSAEEAIRVAGIRSGAYVNPQVSVTLFRRRAHRVTVVGAVKEPGTHELPAAGSDVLTAVVAAGGLSEEAGTMIEIRYPASPGVAANLATFRPDGSRAPGGSGPGVTVTVDLEQLDDRADLRLPDGATVMVMPRPKRYIHVIGLVKRADQFEIPADQELRLLDAIALAGGRTVSIADKVHVMRHLPDQEEPIVITASVQAAKSDSNSNIRLAAGDVVSVEETPTTFVVGTIRDFVRFGFSSALPGF